MSVVINNLKKELGDIVQMLDDKILAFDRNRHGIAELMGAGYRVALYTKRITLLDTLHSIRLYEQAEENLTDNSHAC